MGLPLPDDASAGPELAAEYAAAREREGRVMAILRALGPRAEVVRAFLELADAVLYGPAALGRRERELLALATSEANGADYSAGVHATLLSELGDAELQARLSDAEVYDAVAVVGLLNLANRSALAMGITIEDDLP